MSQVICCPNKGGIGANSLLYPQAVALDSNGNLYVADTNNSRVLYYPAGSTTATRVYGQGGSFTTFIFQAYGGISANSLSYPRAVALDSIGNPYIADTANSRVLYYPGGSTTATRVYGQGGSFTTNTKYNGYIGADSLFDPSGVVLDTSNRLYVADNANNRVLEYRGRSCVVDPGNAIAESNKANNACQDTVTVSAPAATTLNKTAGDGQSANTSTAYATNLNVTVFDQNGNPFQGAQVTFAAVAGGTGASGTFAATPTQPITTLADGTATAPVLTPNGTPGAFTVTATAGALTATFNLTNALPPDLTAVKTDNVGGATTLGTPWTWKIHLANGGNGAANFLTGATILTDNLPSTNIGYGSAGTANPVGITGTISCAIASNILTCTASGAVSIAAGGSIDVSFLATPTAIGTFVNPPPTPTTAGAVYGQGGSFTNGAENTGGITVNSLRNPYGSASDSGGNLYVADYANHRVLYYPAGSTTATQVYGQGGSFTSNTANNGGVGANSLNFPVGVALDSAGNLYVADQFSNRVLYYAGGSTTATRVYGQGGSFTTATPNNGGVGANSLNGPIGLALDSGGNLYVADRANHRVLYYPAGSTTATGVYGQGGSFTTNTSNKGGIGANSLNNPYGSASDSGGNLYLADHANHRVLYYPAGSTTATRVYGQGG
ncbi:MAG: NHL repeat-containing protein, partial [Actinomycetota bacterium]|nr:NHL repeat-containing protein [Actinomycetota bacterium]